MADRRLAEAPLVRLHDQAIREVGLRLSGSRYERRVVAEEQAVRDAAFLFALVTVLNATAEEMVQVGDAGHQRGGKGQ